MNCSTRHGTTRHMKEDYRREKSTHLLHTVFVWVGVELILCTILRAQSGSLAVLKADTLFRHRRVAKSYITIWLAPGYTLCRVRFNSFLLQGLIKFLNMSLSLKYCLFLECITKTLCLLFLECGECDVVI